MSLFVNGLQFNSMRWLASWSGVWCAELELPHGTEVVPSGRVVIASEALTMTLVGTVDSDHSGSFSEKKSLRVLAGGGGWQKNVRKKTYHSDIGIPLAMVATTTAAEVAEIVTVLTPKVIGKDFIRAEGAASQVFTEAGVDWWVGLDGITRVGTRLPSIQPASLVVKDWNPTTRMMQFTASALIEPGTIIVDPRFGKQVVRQVEATIAGGLVSGTLFTADAPPKSGSYSELIDDLAALSREATRITFARFHEYRVIAMAGDRVELQAINPIGGLPNVLPGSVWGGISGYKATLQPASRVLVGFIGGDPRYPFVAAFEPSDGVGWRPIRLELDALLSIELGGPTATGVATMESMTPLFFAIGLFFTSMQAFLNFPLIAALSGGTAQAPATNAAAVIALLATFPTNFSQRVKAAR